MSRRLVRSSGRPDSFQIFTVIKLNASQEGFLFDNLLLKTENVHHESLHGCRLLVQIRRIHRHALAQLGNLLIDLGCGGKSGKKACQGLHGLHNVIHRLMHSVAIRNAL
jgi:hypothetical protein